jgi:hypothetical protein
MLLTAFGSLAINVPDIRKYGDWPLSDVREFLSTASFLAFSGAVFLFAAYALFKTKSWSTYFAAVVSASALALMAVAWSGERIDPAGFAIALLFLAVPIWLTLVWALVATARQLKERRTTQGRGHQIA